MSINDEYSTFIFLSEVELSKQSRPVYNELTCASRVDVTDSNPKDNEDLFEDLKKTKRKIVLQRFLTQDLNKLKEICKRCGLYTDDKELKFLIHRIIIEYIKQYDGKHDDIEWSPKDIEIKNHFSYLFSDSKNDGTTALTITRTTSILTSETANETTKEATTAITNTNTNMSKQDKKQVMNDLFAQGTRIKHRQMDKEKREQALPVWMTAVYKPIPETPKSKDKTKLKNKVIYEMNNDYILNLI